MKTYFRITKLAQKVVSIISPNQKGEKIYLTLLAKLKETTKQQPYNVIKHAFLNLHPGLTVKPNVKSGKTLYLPTYMNYNKANHFALNCLLDAANGNPKKLNFIERLKIEFLTSLRPKEEKSLRPKQKKKENLGPKEEKEKSLRKQEKSFAIKFSKEFSYFVLNCRFSLKQRFKRYFSKKRYKRARAYIRALALKVRARSHGIKSKRMTKNKRRKKRKMRRFRKKIVKKRKENKWKRKRFWEKFTKKKRKRIRKKIKLAKRHYLNPYVTYRRKSKKRIRKYRKKFQTKHLMAKHLLKKRIKIKKLLKKNIKIKKLLKEKLKLKDLLINNIKLKKVFLKGLKNKILLRKKFLKILTKNIKIQIFSFNNLLVKTLKDNILLRRRFIRVLKINNRIKNFRFRKLLQKVLVKNSKPKKNKLKNTGLIALFKKKVRVKRLLIEKVKLRKYLVKNFLLETPTKDKLQFNRSQRLFFRKLVKFTRRRSKSFLKRFRKRKLKRFSKRFRRRYLKPKVFIKFKRYKEETVLKKRLKNLQKFNKPFVFKHFISRYSYEGKLNRKYRKKYRFIKIKYKNNNYYNISKNNYIHFSIKKSFKLSKKVDVPKSRRSEKVIDKAISIFL